MCVALRIWLIPATHPQYTKYAKYLVPGWMGSRWRDNSDIQYRLFRDHAVTIAAIMTIQAAMTYVLRSIVRACRLSAVTAKQVRICYLFVLGVVFVSALHGINALKLFLIAVGNYRLVRLGVRLPRRLATVLVWLYNAGMLFVVFYTSGLPFESVSSSWAWLDAYTGLLPRWWISFNFGMLRLVSFALDALWATDEKTPRTPKNAKERVRQSRPANEYSFVHSLVYLWYPPLFIAGPVMTFNDFAAQLDVPLYIPPRAIAGYMVRCIIALFSMEFMLHYMYVNAIKSARAWEGCTPMELGMIGLFNLEFVWFKLVIPWRVFRLWALLDGVDAPENMIRAITNSPSALGFWRSWHRSYNQWVVRYVYIPLGGSRNQLLAMLVVFTFVALWHDLSFTLLAWAWLIVLFVIPEMLGRYLCPAERYGHRPWFRHIRSLGSVVNVFMMMTANLVGFVIGLDGIQFLWSQLGGTAAGRWYLVGATAVLFVGVQLMYEYRAEEIRRGVLRNC